MIRFTLPKWLSPKPGAVGVLSEQAQDSSELSSEELLVLEPPKQKAEAEPPATSALARNIVDASIDHAYKPSSGQTAHHVRRIM